MTQLRRIAALFGGLVAQVFFILSVTFIVTSGSSTPEYADLHVLHRYVLYIRDLLTFSLGVTRNGVPAEFFILPAIRRSVLILIPPLLMAGLIAMVLMRTAFVRHAGWLHRSTGSLLALGYSIPIPFVAVLLFALAGETGWFPLGMTSSPGHSEMALLARIWDTVHHLILPWLTVGLFPVLILITALAKRLERLENATIVVAATARGLSRRQIFRSHLRRPLLAELVENLAAAMPILVTYMALVETVFRYTGLGFYLVGPYATAFWATSGDDLLVSQGALVYVAIFSVSAQFLFRALQAVLIPQFRGQEGDGPDRRGVALLGLAAFAALAGLAFGLLPPLAGPVGDPAGVFPWLPPAALLLLVLVLAVRSPAGRASRRPLSLRRDRPEAPPAEPSGTGSGERASAAPAPAGLLHHVGAFVRRNRPALIRAAAAGGSLLALSLLATLLPQAEPLPPTADFQPRLVPFGERLLFHLQEAVLVFRSLLPLAAVSFLGVLLALGGAVASVHLRPPFLHRSLTALGLFPTILVVAMLLNLISGFLSFLAAFILVALIRNYGLFRDELRLQAREDYMTYTRTLGRGLAFTSLWHILPNMRRELVRATIVVTADLLVLRANLRFVGIRRPWSWEFGSPDEAGTVGAPAALEGFAELMYATSWGDQIQEAVRMFVRGYYLPVVFPLALLLCSVILLRVLARAVQDMERV